MLTSRQIEGWIAAYRLDPWGEQPAYWRAGVVASVIANVHRKKGSKPLMPSDFLPAPRTRSKKQTSEQMKAALVGIFNWAKKKGLTKEKPASA